MNGICQSLGANCDCQLKTENRDWIALLAKRAKWPIEGSSLAKPSTWLEFVICYLEFTEGRGTGLLFSQGKKSGLGGSFTKKAIRAVVAARCLFPCP